MSQEERRMTAVRNTRLLGTPAEERFDKITRLACRMFRVPISMIDVIGDDVAWMKSAQGTDRLEAPREYSYCHKTSESRDREFLICDARVDPRLYGNPYVQDFVFYAGAALVGACADCACIDLDD